MKYQMKSSESCPECEEEEIQTKSMDNGATPMVQRQPKPYLEEDEVMQGRFLPVQRKSPHFSYNLVNLPAYPPLQRQDETEEEKMKLNHWGAV